MFNLKTVYPPTNTGGGGGIIMLLINKRTSGPVNAHLISGPSKSTKHTNPGKNKVKK